MTVTGFQLDADLNQRLDDVAVQLKRKKDWLVNVAVKQFIENTELKHRMHEETMEALDTVEQGEYHDGAEVLEWVGSWFSDHELPGPKLYR